MSDVKDRDLEKKFEELFEQSELPKRMDAIGNTLKDMDPAEEAEVREHLAKLMGAKNAKKPKRKWIWSFNGVLLFKSILYLVEFIILMSMIYFLLPLSINTNVTIVQALSSTVLLTFLRQWFK